MEIGPDNQLFQLFPPTYLYCFASAPLFVDNFPFQCLYQIGGGQQQQSIQTKQISQTKTSKGKWVKQKTLRYKNMVSNIVNLMLSYIMSQTWEQQQRSSFAYIKQNCKQFLQGVNHLKKSFHNFFNIQKLIDQLNTPFSQPQTQHFNTLFRSLVKNYLHNVSHTAIITSKKITKQNKLLHLKLRRGLIRLLEKWGEEQTSLKIELPIHQHNNFD